MTQPLPLTLPSTLERLIRALAPERIVLFGSHARGTAHANSDIDLLVIANWQGEAARYLRHGRQLVARSFPRVDLMFCSPAEVEAAHAGRSPFLLSVLESGLVVYNRE